MFILCLFLMQIVVKHFELHFLHEGCFLTVLCPLKLWTLIVGTWSVSSTTPTIVLISTVWIVWSSGEANRSRSACTFALDTTNQESALLTLWQKQVLLRLYLFTFTSLNIRTDLLDNWMELWVFFWIFLQVSVSVIVICCAPNKTFTTWETCVIMLLQWAECEGRTLWLCAVIQEVLIRTHTVFLTLYCLLAIVIWKMRRESSGNVGGKEREVIFPCSVVSDTAAGFYNKHTYSSCKIFCCFFH